MAKRFLEQLDEVYDDHVLENLIPQRKAVPSTKTTAPQKRATKSQRKSFLSVLESTAPVKKPASTNKKQTKSFLGALEEVMGGLKQEDIESLFPSQRPRRSKTSKKQTKQSRITTTLDSKVLASIRKIAHEHNIPLKEVIQQALKMYLEKE